MFGPMRNLKANICSMDRLEKMSSFDTLDPSHAKYPISKETITLIKDGCKNILDGKVNFEEKEMFGHLVKYYDIGCTKILCD